MVPPVYCSSATSSAVTTGHAAGAVAPSVKALKVTMRGSSGIAACGVPTLPQ
ncbi:hypothetical protein ABH989_007498 [Bradyrhizobium ottawaense]